MSKTTSVIVRDVLETLARRLGAASGMPARQEARDLIAAVLDRQKFWPTAHGSRELTAEQSAAIDAAAERLLQGMPMAYAARRAGFRHLSLYVDQRVLIPRPETEVLVELVLEASKGRGVAVDVGTGSGCIALSLACEGQFERVIATDLSDDAVAVTLLNHGAAAGAPRERAMAPVDVRCGSFLSTCADGEADVIVSNPPYISWSEATELPALVREWEPKIALFADDDGMAAIREIARDGVRVLKPGGLLALEVDSQRAGRAAEIVRAHAEYHDVVVRPDLTGRARFVLARRLEDVSDRRKGA